MHTQTHEQLIIKNIDYSTEEYIKQLLVNTSERKLITLNPYCGVIRYPSTQFLDNGVTYKQAVQFQNSTYVGFMDMLLPVGTVQNGSKLSYTLLQFNLDGVLRQLLQISKPDVKDLDGISFKDYLYSLYPNAGHQIPFNRSALHILTDIQITGAECALNAANHFYQINSGTGSFTTTLEFEIAVSGYKAILQ